MKAIKALMKMAATKAEETKMDTSNMKKEEQKEEQKDLKPLRLEIKRVRIGVSAGARKGGGSTSDY